jgi:natural product biosynthesis luciferase-like monooxygenase protein
MDFSIMFWGSVNDSDRDHYRLLLETTKYADENGFAAVWIPERHFHPWGGLYPNPSVLCAALATVTKRIRLRAGSVVVPLHHPVRMAEEWAVVDQLSGGRVEISIASGWRADDFVLAPEIYASRKQVMMQTIDAVQKLWRGEKFVAKNPKGETIESEIYPRPLQEEIPLWLTSAGALGTIARAGKTGFGLLTHLLGQSFDDLLKSIGQYQANRAQQNLSRNGKVALMLHAFVGKDRAKVKEVVREPMLNYLMESSDLAIQGSQRADWDALDRPAKLQSMVGGFERYFEQSGLMGDIDSCRAVVQKAARAGVTDICCLVDFGLPTELVLEHLRYLTELKDSFAGRA